jgi:hypothetical protein
VIDFLTAGMERKRGGGCYSPPVSRWIFAAARGGDAPPLFIVIEDAQKPPSLFTRGYTVPDSVLGVVFVILNCLM